MAYSKASKVLKELTKIDERTMAVVLSRKDPEQLEELFTLCSGIKNECFRELDEEQEVTDPQKKGKKANKTTVFYTMFLPRQISFLEAYEENAELDSFSVDVQGYFQFKHEKLHNQFDHHDVEGILTKIGEYEGKCNRLLLLFARDRGFVYQKIKENCAENNISFKQELRRLSLAYSTVSKYIQLYTLIEMYPRILASKSPVIDWITYMSLFQKYLEENEEMGVRFGEPLKEFEEEQDEEDLLDEEYQDATPV